MISTKESIPVTVISYPDHIEALTVKVEWHNPLILSCVYIPPNPPLSIVQDIISYLSNLSCLFTFSNVIVVGDFNLPDINWDSLSASTSISNLFCDFLFNNNLSQLVNEPTHIKGNILDLVLTNSDNDISNSNLSSAVPYEFRSLHCYLRLHRSQFYQTAIYSQSKYLCF